MKKTIFALAAIAAIVSCNKPEDNFNAGETIRLSALSGISQTRVTMGAKDGQTYPMAWDAVEHAYLREIVLPEGGGKDTTFHYASSTFSKTDAHNGKFTFDVARQTVEGTYEYVAVYPCNATNPRTSLDNGVRFGGDDQKNRASYALSFSKAQVPAADGPDAATHLMWAYDLGKPAQAQSVNLAFEPVVAYAKMTVKNFPDLGAGETVSQIKVITPEAKKMTGRVFKYFHKVEGSHEVGDIVPYNSNNVKNYVLVDPMNISVNSTAFDVWFTTFPLNLAAEDKLSLEVTTSHNTYTAAITLSKELKFQAGVVSEFVYDWQKGQTKVETKTLVFDFSTCPDGWPDGTTYSSEDVTPDTVSYVVRDTAYRFIVAPCPDASNRGTCWGYASAGDMFFMQVHRYLGLPAIEGFKLTKVAFVMSASTNTIRKAGVASGVVGKDETKPLISGGGAKVTGTKGTEYKFDLDKTAANTVYYLVCTNKAIGFTKLTLTYEKVEQK